MGVAISNDVERQLDKECVGGEMERTKRILKLMRKGVRRSKAEWFPL